MGPKGIIDQGLGRVKKFYWWGRERKRCEAGAETLEQLEKFERFEPVVELVKKTLEEPSAEQYRESLSYLQEHFAQLQAGSLSGLAGLALHLDLEGEAIPTLAAHPDLSWCDWAQATDDPAVNARAVSLESQTEFNPTRLGELTLTYLGQVEAEKLEEGLKLVPTGEFGEWVEDLTPLPKDRVHLKAGFLAQGSSENPTVLATLGLAMDPELHHQFWERAKGTSGSGWLGAWEQLESDPTRRLEQAPEPANFSEAVASLAAAPAEPEHNPLISKTLRQYARDPADKQVCRLLAAQNQVAAAELLKAGPQLPRVVAALPDTALKQGLNHLLSERRVMEQLLHLGGPEAVRAALLSQDDGSSPIERIRHLASLAPEEKRDDFLLEQYPEAMARALAQVPASYPTERFDALVAGLADPSGLSSFRQLSRPEEAVALARVFLRKRGLEQVLELPEVDRWNLYRLARRALEISKAQPDRQLALVEIGLAAPKELRSGESRLAARTKLAPLLPEAPGLAPVSPHQEDAFQQRLELLRASLENGLLRSDEPDQREVSWEENEVEVGDIPLPVGS